MNSNQLPVNEYSRFNATYIDALENVELLEELEQKIKDAIVGTDVTKLVLQD